MPENDPHEQTDPAGESTDHVADEAAVPSDQGAESADSAGAPSTSESFPADSADLDGSLSKIEKLSQALAKLSQASADDAFAAKIRQLTHQASDVQDEPDDRPTFEAPTEEIQAPVDAPLEPQRPAESGELPPMSPQMPVEPTLPTQPSDEQLSASEPDEITPTETALESTDTVQLHEPFDPYPLDDIAGDLADDGFEVSSEAAWESTDEHVPSDAAPIQTGADDAPGFESEASAPFFDVADPQQPTTEDPWETEDGALSEAMTTEHQGDEPPAEMVESAAQEPGVPSDVPQEIEQDTAGPEYEQTDDAERPDTSVDTEATPIAAEQPDESAAEEQNSNAGASGGTTTATDDGDREPESARDVSVSDSPRATVTAEALESQIGEFLDSTGGVQPTAPPRVPRASAQGPIAGGLVEDQPAPSPPAGSVDLDWLAAELDQMLNPGAQDSASVDHPASPQTEVSFGGAAEQDDSTPELPGQETSPSDESSLADDASASTIPEPDDGPRVEENDSEQAEVVSGIDVQESPTPQEEIAPTEPIDADSSDRDESIDDSEPSDSADASLDDLTAQIDDLVQPEGEPSVAQADVPEETTEAVAADEPRQDATVEAMEAPSPPAIDAIEADEPATSVDDELAGITAQLDELLDSDGHSSAQETPSVVADEATAVIDTAAPPGEPEAARQSIETARATEAEAPPPDEGLAEIDKTLADEVEELINGVADSAQDAADDDLGEPAAPAVDFETQTILSEVESEDPTSSAMLDEASAATDPSGEGAKDVAEPAALDAQTTAESETDWTMDTQEPTESAPDAQVESETQRQDGAEPKRGSAKHDDDEDPRASQTEELKEAAVAAVRFARLHGALQRIEPIAVPVLRRVNYPLRYVPQTLRPIVDWIALSLLFWVPIVWVIALLAS